MGYRSYFSLTESTLTEEQINSIDYTQFKSPEDMEELLKDYEVDDQKWYDFEDDMKMLSELFPDNLFKVRVIGEQSDDVSDAYFKGGEMVRLYTEIPPLNEEQKKLLNI